MSAKRLWAACLPLLLLFPLAARAADDSVGSAYLLRGVSPQEDALGGGALAAYGNPAAQWENPAALAGVGTLGLCLTEEIAPLGGDAQYAAAGLGLGPQPWQRVGVQAYLRDDSDTFRDGLGQVTGTFSDLDALFGLSYAATFGPWSLGAGLKTVTETLAGQSAQPGLLCDLGAIYAPGPDTLFSGALRNVGAMPRWPGLSPQGAESLELSARENLLDGNTAPHLFQFLSLANLGTSTLASDYGIGVDYTVSDTLPLVLRASYGDTNAGTAFPYGLSAGFGYSWTNFECDYAFSSLGELGFSNRLGVTWTPRHL